MIGYLYDPIRALRCTSTYEFRLKGHGSLLRTGLVYQDRTEKKAYQALQTIYRGLP